MALSLWSALKRQWLLYHLGDQRLRYLYDKPPADEWVSVDCETTGLNPRKDDIIAIGAVRIVGNRVMTSEALQLLVKPSRAISADAVKVHGLRERDVAQGWTLTTPCANCWPSSARARWWATTSNSTWR